MTLRLLIADDELLIRSGLRMVLSVEPGIKLVAEAADGIEAVEVAMRQRIDVALIDVRMPRLDGIRTTERLMQLGDRAPRVLILTTYDLDEHVVAALRAGASGFLLKDTAPERLAEAIRVVAAGDALLAPSVTRRLIERYARHGPDSRRVTALEELTPRERDVLALLARGLTNAEVADTLVVAESTVKSHVSAVFAKLGVRDRAQAVVFAYESGLIEPGSR